MVFVKTNRPIKKRKEKNEKIKILKFLKQTKSN
jgi:hypothetical protein